MKKDTEPYLSKEELRNLAIEDLTKLPPTVSSEELVSRLQRFSALAQRELAQTGSISAGTRQVLLKLTSTLRHAKIQTGDLSQHPYERIRKNAPSVLLDVKTYLAGKSVMVTGAGGVIGRLLCDELLRLGVTELTLADRNKSRLEQVIQASEGKRTNARIRGIVLDIASEGAVREAYELALPQVVFHLAAERSQETAELKVRDSIRTHISGTKHLAEMAVKFGVERFIFASTGQCRYIYDERVYPATERYAEAIVKVAINKGSTSFSIVRIHHVVENSLVEMKFREQAEKGQPLTPHLPADRKKHGQSAAEAVAMLLNSGLYGRDAEIFGSTRQMDYFNVLDLALYIIGESQKDLPIIFEMAKTAEGYESKEFGGTRLQSVDAEITHAFNAIETAGLCVFEQADLVMARFPRFEEDLAIRQVGELVASTEDNTISDESLKRLLLTSLHQHALDIYSRVPIDLVLTSLTAGVWGPPAFSINSFENFVSYATRLKLASDPLSAFLKDKLSHETLDALRTWAGEAVPESLKKLILRDINSIMACGCSIFDADRFAGITLRQDTREILQQHAQGEDLVRLNRMLIEDAYPLEVTQPPVLPASHLPLIVIILNALNRHAFFTRQQKATLKRCCDYLALGFEGDKKLSSELEALRPKLL